MSVTAGPHVGAMDRLLLGLKRLEMGQNNFGADILVSKGPSQSARESASGVNRLDSAAKQQVAAWPGTEGPGSERYNLQAMEPGFMKLTAKALAVAQEGAGRVAHRNLSSPAKRPWVVANWPHVVDEDRSISSNHSPAAAAALKVCATSYGLWVMLTKKSVQASQQ